ncbi:hypothetical protein [Thioalkalivibrio sp. ALJT]|uniref:hypothetical protein n=1 Tax=Thioalkalivibrio sp. ALJT TaxID=1158146 RepID=UPI0012DF87B1|nr:hypothetical protein [Thioalkalivibrio sp. ALJT]
MLVESAFSILPESVAGFGFQKVRREANAVSCFSFSLLNALHAKNILDPIQRIQLEHAYSTQKVPLPSGGNNRHCDIFLDYGGSKIGTKLLANYGWRYRNYVEAKFLKCYKKTNSGQDTRASSNSAELMADLLRLVVLVPEPEVLVGKQNPKTSSARYLLVIADNPPEIFVNKYLTSLHSVFEKPAKMARITVDLSSGKAAGAFAEKVGTGFSGLTLDITSATCFAHYPLDPSGSSMLWMLLIRIDAARISGTFNGVPSGFAIDSDRSVTEDSAGDYMRIRDFVAINIK